MKKVKDSTTSEISNLFQELIVSKIIDEIELLKKELDNIKESNESCEDKVEKLPKSSSISRIVEKEQTKVIDLINKIAKDSKSEEYLRAIVEYLKKNDYTPLIMHTGNSIAEEIRSIERLKNMNVDGIMVLATSTTKEYEEVVKHLQIPILFLGQRFPGANSIINDDYNAGYKVGEYIGKRAFEQIYLLWVSKEDPAVGEERRRGVIDGLFSCGKEPTEVIETSFFFEAAVHNVEKLIEKVKKPAALICATDRIAQGAYKVFYEKNIAIPEEVSVVGFGDYETGELMRPPLTTVKFDWKNWGESSAETMLQMIQEKPVSQIQVNPYEFIERESVR